MVQGPTPDLVLTGVELLAAEVGRAVAVVDIGGATTDVHSVVPLDPEDAGLAREVVASTPVTRTVEGDLGMRWSALSTWEAGVEAGLLETDAGLHEAARLRSDDPAFLPGTDAEREADLRLAGVAATLAVRRHVGRSRVVVGPDGRVVRAHRQGPARGGAARRLRRRPATCLGVPTRMPSWLRRPGSRRRGGSSPSTRGW